MLLVVTLYTYVGGMWAISITDFIQSIIIVVGLLVLAIVLADKAGGVGVVIEGMPEENFRFLPTCEFEGDCKLCRSLVCAWARIDSFAGCFSTSYVVGVCPHCSLVFLHGGLVVSHNRDAAAFHKPLHKTFVSEGIIWGYAACTSEYGAATYLSANSDFIFWLVVVGDHEHNQFSDTCACRYLFREPCETTFWA